MANHPAFMQEWDPSKPMTPELEALINLKYEECDDLKGKIQLLSVHIYSHFNIESC